MSPVSRSTCALLSAAATLVAMVFLAAAASAQAMPAATQRASTSLYVSADRTSVTVGSQAVTFSGRVTITPPGGSAAVSIGSGIGVYLNGSAHPVTTTDLGGDFRYTVTGITKSAGYEFSIPATGLYTGASDQVEVDAVPAASLVAVSAISAQVTFGAPDVTFSGSVTALPAGATKAVGVGAGVHVYLSVGGGAAKQVTTTTDASGDFSYTVGGVSRSTDYVFSVDATTLYTAATGEVLVPLVPATSTISATASPADTKLTASTVKFSGSVTVTPAGSSSAEGIGAGLPVYLSVGGGTASQVTTTTDASGDFSYTAKGVKQAADYQFSLPASTYYLAAATTVPIGMNQLHSTLTVTPSNSSVTEGSQSVTFSGTLKGVAPGSTTEQAISNAPVDLNGATSNPVATTNSAGEFSYTVTGISTSTEFDFSVAGSTGYSAAEADLQVGTSPVQTRIVQLRRSPPHVVYGKSAKLTGTVQFLGSKGWRALAGASVQLKQGAPITGRLTTNRDGGFAAQLSSKHGSVWGVTVRPTGLTDESAAVGALDIAVPVAIRAFSARLLADGYVGSDGCLQVTVPVGYGPQPLLEIQYSAASRGPWHTLGLVQLHNPARQGAYCSGSRESSFSGAIRARLDNAYYRAVFPASYSFRPAVSKVVHSWRYQTKITPFNVSPRTVGFGQVVTISGRLWALGKSGWEPDANQTIVVAYNQQGTLYWNSLGSVTTNAHGYFSLQATGGAGPFVAIIYADYGGDPTHLASQSRGIHLSIAGSDVITQRTPAPRLAPLGMPAVTYPDVIQLTTVTAGAP